MLRELAGYSPPDTPRRVERAGLRTIPLHSLLDKLDRAIKEEGDTAAKYRAMGRELRSLRFFAESGEVSHIAETETGHASMLNQIRRKVRAANGSR